jgi:hypothetical protein
MSIKKQRLQPAMEGITGAQNEACYRFALYNYRADWLLLVNLSDVDRVVWSSVFAVVCLDLCGCIAPIHRCDSLVGIPQRVDTLVAYPWKLLLGSLLYSVTYFDDP